MRSELTELLKLSKWRAGKEVAHLTYERLEVTPETKPWPFVQIANEITSVINVFIQQVPKSKLGKQWESVYKAQQANPADEG
jgi:hypothetical protein